MATIKQRTLPKDTEAGRVETTIVSSREQAAKLLEFFKELNEEGARTRPHELAAYQCNSRGGCGQVCTYYRDMLCQALGSSPRPRCPRCNSVMKKVKQPRKRKIYDFSTR